MDQLPRHGMSTACSPCAALTAISIFLVPGAWHHSIHYQLLRDGLQTRSQGRDFEFSVNALELPSSSYAHPADFDMQDDAAYIRDKVAGAVDAGNDVILVAHSYGGVPTSQVSNIEGLRLQS